MCQYLGDLSGCWIHTTRARRTYSSFCGHQQRKTEEQTKVSCYSFRSIYFPAAETSDVVRASTFKYFWNDMENLLTSYRPLLEKGIRDAIRHRLLMNEIVGGL